MYEPAVTCGGPDGRMLEASGLQVLAASWPVPDACVALDVCEGPAAASAAPGAASAASVAASAPASSPAAASTASPARVSAFTGTLLAGGSGPRRNRPP